MPRILKTGLLQKLKNLQQPPVIPGRQRALLFRSKFGGGFEQALLCTDTGQVLVVGDALPGITGGNDPAAAVHEVDQYLDPAVFDQSFAPGFRTVGHNKKISLIQIFQPRLDDKIRAFFQSGELFDGLSVSVEGSAAAIGDTERTVGRYRQFGSDLHAGGIVDTAHEDIVGGSQVFRMETCGNDFALAVGSGDQGRGVEETHPRSAQRTEAAGVKSVGFAAAFVPLGFSGNGTAGVADQKARVYNC